MTVSGFVVLWEFQVSDSMEGMFERFYSVHGDWVQLFRKSPEFIRTELIRDLNKPQRYVTMDFLKTQSDYETFRRGYHAAYEALDLKCRNFTTSELNSAAFALFRSRCDASICRSRYQ